MVIMDLKEKKWSSSEIKKCCTDCKTTKTPLWRGGPAGPKTLCNACGIRYRKRRACTVGMNKGQERKRERAQTQRISGSGKTVVGGGGSDLRESLKMKLMALGEEVLLQRSPSLLKKQRRNKLGEEEQAAMCLMALSCGFVFA
ncbi:Zinc finger, GATA-type [Sesbania bispinosa]|nr:Zinc finger, GATA-type [Sesbania bispinosa]